MIPHSRPTLDHEEAAVVTRVLLSGQVAQGEEGSALLNTIHDHDNLLKINQ